MCIVNTTPTVIMHCTCYEIHVLSMTIVIRLGLRIFYQIATSVSFACVVSLTEIITNVDEVDLIMFNSISKSNTKSNKNNLDVVQLAASVRMICIQ